MYLQSDVLTVSTELGDGEGRIHPNLGMKAAVMCMSTTVTSVLMEQLDKQLPGEKPNGGGHRQAH